MQSQIPRYIYTHTQKAKTIILFLIQRFEY